MSHVFGTLRARLAISVIALAALALVAGMAVFSAFSSTQASSTNTFTAGTVALTTNGTGSVLFNLPNMQPGDSTSQCVEVTYNGSLSAGVQMYGTVSGSLAPYLNTTITRGTFPGAAPANNDCTGFTPDSGGGSLYTGELSALPDSSNPISDPGTWTTGSVHDYEITVALPTDTPDAAQGLTASAAFTWQASNS
jgi:predicted ribosomally synthesized peptide with SipW-like signal peptide